MDIQKLYHIEQKLLGALMEYQDAMIDISDILKPHMFNTVIHQQIYQSCCDLFNEGKGIDQVTVSQNLTMAGAYNEYFQPKNIHEVVNNKGSFFTCVEYANIIKNEYLRRTLTEKINEVQEVSKQPHANINDLVNGLMNTVDDVINDNIASQTKDINQVIKEAIPELMSHGHGQSSGITSGLIDLDDMTKGFQPSALIILAARPAMGKTALMTTIIKACARSGSACAIFSLEMDSFSLFCRMVSEDIKVSSNVLTTKQLTDYQKKLLNDGVVKLQDLPIFIDDQPNTTITEIRTKLKRLKQKHDIKFAVIDYLQLMSGSKKSQSREQEISEISRGLKLVAKELKIPIMALSQLNRSVEQRGGQKIPELSDLRESGSIEQDADMVMFIHRPEYYGLTHDEDGNSVEGRADLYIRKHRNGKVGMVKTKFEGQYTAFYNWDESNFPF